VPIQHLANLGLPHTHGYHLAKDQRLLQHTHGVSGAVQAQHGHPLPPLVHLHQGRAEPGPSHLARRSMPLEAVDQLQAVLPFHHHQRRQLPVRG
jgi:hypothetical protein